MDYQLATIEPKTTTDITAIFTPGTLAILSGLSTAAAAWHRDNRLSIYRERRAANKGTSANRA